MSEFKVKDHRLFDKDGNLNPDSEAEPWRPDPAPAGADSAALGGQGQEPPLSIGDLPATLSTLVIGLATQALTLLGEPPMEGEEPQPPDLPAAKHAIDLLGILQKKTQGNLDASEEALMEALLYDLRMKYVALKKGS